jgi:ABC-type transport system involved in multi-copper enzyme maturation permease subunit
MAKFAGIAPVFAIEARAVARRWQAYAVRSLFIAGLLAALAFGFLAEQQQQSSPRGASRAGFWFFSAISIMQLGLVMLVAPAATAGSFSHGTAREALALALATELSSVEIVIGKLLARLLPVFGLMACSLPVVILAAFLGGVDPDAFLASTAVLAGAAVLGCALGLAFSVWANRTDEALLAAYAVLVAWVAACPGWVFFNQIGWLPSRPPSWLTGSNPVLVIAAQVWTPGQTGWLEISMLVAALLAVAVAVTILAIATLRARTTRSPNRGWRGFRARAGRLKFASLLDRDPVLWRERQRRRATGWVGWMWVLYDLCAIAATATIIILVMTRGLGPSTDLASLLNGLQVAAGMLLLAVRATTAFAEERSGGGLQVLLSTPLESQSILMAKWRGAFATVPRLTVLPVLAAFAVACRSGRFEGVIAIAGAILCYGAWLTSLGLVLATWLPRAGFAATLGVAAHVLATVGWFFVAAVASSATPGLGALAIAAGSPFFAVGIGTMAMHDMPLTDWREFLAWLVLWMFLELMAAFVLLASTRASFDRCLGRV